MVNNTNLGNNDTYPSIQQPQSTEIVMRKSNPESDPTTTTESVTDALEEESELKGCCKKWKGRFDIGINTLDFSTDIWTAIQWIVGLNVSETLSDCDDQLKTDNQVLRICALILIPCSMLGYAFFIFDARNQKKRESTPDKDEPIWKCLKLFKLLVEDYVSIIITWIASAYYFGFTTISVISLAISILSLVITIGIHGVYKPYKYGQNPDVKRASCHKLGGCCCGCFLFLAIIFLILVILVTPSEGDGLLVVRFSYKSRGLMIYDGQTRECSYVLNPDQVYEVDGLWTDCACRLSDDESVIQCGGYLTENENSFILYGNLTEASCEEFGSDTYSNTTCDVCFGSYKAGWSPI